MDRALPVESIFTRLRQRWIMALFALPFAGAGLAFLALSILATLWESWQMQSWYESRATLQSAHVETSVGEDSTSYKAVASYTYDYGGRSYQGERVSLSSGYDNIGSYQQDMGERLMLALARRESIPVWVNPDNPAESILDPNPRWILMLFMSLFVLVFGGAGFGLLWLCLFKPLDTVPKPQLAGIDVDNQPWLSRKSWARPEVPSNAKSSVVWAWVFAGLWNLVAIPTGIMVTPEVFAGNYAAAVGWLFPLVGMGLLHWVIRATLRWKRFGKTLLHMDPYPGAIGGQVGGTVDLNLPYQPGHLFKATLSCLYSRMTRSGKDRRREEKLVWQSAGFAHGSPHRGGTRLEVLFDVDAGLPESETRESSSYHLWRLNISGELDGADLDRNFEIPVFNTGQSASQLKQLSTDHPMATDHRLDEIESVLDLEQIPGGVHIYYPAFKKPAGKIVGLIIGIVFVVMGQIAGGQGAASIFPVVFGLVGGGIALACLYSLIRSLDVVIDHDGLRARIFLLGIRVSNKRLRRHDIEGLRIKLSYSQSQGHKHQEFFKLQAVNSRGGTIDIGYNLAGRNVALQAMESIAMLTGLPVKE